MAEAIRSFTIVKPHSQRATRFLDSNPVPRTFSGPCHGNQQLAIRKLRRGLSCRVNALPDWPLMAVMVEQMQSVRELDFISNKSIWHLSDDALKSVYTFYIMFTCWGCLFFGSMKDPYYDSETYRGDGGDGTGNWLYERQDDIEETARAELWREELIEEIEQKVEGLRELEEAGRK